jgi:hypothetical protein
MKILEQGYFGVSKFIEKSSLFQKDALCKSCRQILDTDFSLNT